MRVLGPMRASLSRRWEFFYKPARVQALTSVLFAEPERKREVSARRNTQSKKYPGPSKVMDCLSHLLSPAQVFLWITMLGK